MVFERAWKKVLQTFSSFTYAVLTYWVECRTPDYLTVLFNQY